MKLQAGFDPSRPHYHKLPDRATTKKKNPEGGGRNVSECVEEHTTQTNTTGNTRRLRCISAELEKQLSLRFFSGGTMESPPRSLGRV